MKRYDLINTGFADLPEIEMVEADCGEWVMYDDVEGIEKIGFGRVHCALCGADLSKGNHEIDCALFKFQGNE